MNKTNEIRGCISCHHGLNDRVHGALFCRRYPRVPMVNVEPGPNYGKVFSHFPAHEPMDICGEYVKSEAKVRAVAQAAASKPKETQQ